MCIRSIKKKSIFCNFDFYPILSFTFSYFPAASLLFSFFLFPFSPSLYHDFLCSSLSLHSPFFFFFFPLLFFSYRKFSALHSYMLISHNSVVLIIDLVKWDTHALILGLSPVFLCPHDSFSYPVNLIIFTILSHKGSYHIANLLISV